MGHRLRGAPPRQPADHRQVWDDSAAAKAFRASAPPAITLLFSYARSLLKVPLKVRDRLIGLLVVDGERPGQFDLRAAQLARALANQAAVAIENVRLYDQGRERAAFEEGTAWRASCTIRSRRACTPRRCWGSRCRRRGTAIPIRAGRCRRTCAT